MSSSPREQLAHSLLGHLGRDRFRRIRLRQVENGDEGFIEVAFSVDNDRDGLESTQAFLKWTARRAEICAASAHLHPYWVRSCVVLGTLHGAGDLPSELAQELETACRRGTLLRPFTFVFSPVPDFQEVSPSAPTPPALEEEDEDLDPRLDDLSAACGDGRFEEALLTVDALLKERPGRPPRLLYLKGLCLDHLDRHEEAEALLREAAEASPGTSTYRYDLAVCLTMQGKHEEALVAYDEVLAIDPTFEDAANNAAWLCHDEGKKRRAVFYFRCLLDLPTVADERRRHALSTWKKLLPPIRAEVDELLGAAEQEEAIPWVRGRLADVLAPLLGRKRLLTAYDGQGWPVRDPMGNRAWRLEGKRGHWSLMELPGGTPVLTLPIDARNQPDSPCPAAPER